MTPEEFKRIRTEAGLTQAQIAELLDVTRTAVRHWEAGRRPISGSVRIVMLVLERKRQLFMELAKR